MRVKDYCVVDWKTIVRYNEDSESGLSWIVGKINFGKFIDNTRVGKTAGSISKGRNKYWTIGLSSGQYYVHRIIWMLKNGEIAEDHDIDHINGNGLNNNITNLRCVPKTINMRNKSMRKDNTTGTNGVVFENNKNTSGYRDYLTDIGGKTHRKFFSINKYPNAQDLAIEWRKQNSWNQGGMGTPPDTENKERL